MDKRDVQKSVAPQIGELVWVAKGVPCCGHEIPSHGTYFVISALVQSPEMLVCTFCGARMRNIVFAIGSHNGAIPIDMLRRAASPAPLGEEA